MANIRKPAELAGAKALAKAPKLKRFRVLYAVTRGEWYEIMATDEHTAESEAFCDGTLFDAGDVTDLAPCDIKEVRS